jgi:Undecaprenyl-phosphate galactose phosphotransferase WbaP
MGNGGDESQSLPSLRTEMASAIQGAPSRMRVVAAQVFSDLFVLACCLHAAYIIRKALVPWWPEDIHPAQWRGLIPILAVIPIGLWWTGCYPGYGQRGVERLRKRVRVVVAATALAVGVDYLVLSGQWSRGILIMAFVLATILLPLSDALLRELLVRWRWWGMPVVAVGDGPDAQRVVRSLQEFPHLGFRPVAVLDRAGIGAGSDLPVFSDLNALRKAGFGGAAAVAVVPPDQRSLGSELHTLPFYRVILVPGWTGLQSLWVDARDLGGMLGLEIRQNLLLLRNRVIKKTMDLVLVGPCFLAAAPVIAVFAVAVKLVDRGPAFYAQEREGLRGRRIRVWKLRTMIVDSQTALDRHLAANPAAREEWDRFCKLKDDPRILPVIGRFMRSTSIDELPQLWNVVRGDLSLVGPRPFPVYHLEKFPEDFRKLRASVMPGVTGLWQVSERSDADIERQELLDTYYIRNWSPWMDLQLLFRTVWALAFRRGGAR